MRGRSRRPPRLSDANHGLELVAVEARLLLEAGGADPPARIPGPHGPSRAAPRRRPCSGEAAERPGSWGRGRVRRGHGAMTAARRNEWARAACAPGWVALGRLMGELAPGWDRAAAGAAEVPSTHLSA